MTTNTPPIDTPTLVRRADYREPDYLVPQVFLRFDLDRDRTVVLSRAQYVRQGQAGADGTVSEGGSGGDGARKGSRGEIDPGGQDGPPLVLDGEDLELLAIRLDGQPLAADRYRVEPHRLVIVQPPARFELEIEVAIVPAANRQLSGLYASGTMLLTQCEAQGFRRITYWQDRPDVMSQYRVELRADPVRHPVLLGNGNLVSSGATDDGRHAATWEDPFPKPSYLFAVVAGQLDVQEARWQTASGKPRLLQIWVEPGNLDKTAHAMESLKRAMAWDEARFGLELDLERFMIVAVGDFNMGAMENKGLNIFNSKYLFANPRIATDDDFARIESIVGHEYFHNWTGNRVTCRDWFQLTLKEGLTVFRDQEFSADMLAAGLAADPTTGAGAADGQGAADGNGAGDGQGAGAGTAARQAHKQAQAATASARAVHRIETVRALRATQFAEDAGPMAHPIRPDSYQAIDNFYTATVYEKGSEVIRMLQTLVGRDGFRRGMDLYFQRHDGQAVTCDDFVSAIADANGRDLSRFLRWYATPGTPLVRASGHHDADARRYTLTLHQLNPRATAAGDAARAPVTIPVDVALFTPDGTRLARRMLVLEDDEQAFVFDDVAVAPVPSLLRGFSAPVHLQYAYSADELAFLLAHDDDPFNRWEAGQRLMLAAVQARLDARVDDREDAAHLAEGLDQTVVAALSRAFDDASLDDGMRNQLLLLPSEGAISETLPVVDPQPLRDARRALRVRVATALADRLLPLVAAGHWRQPYDLSVARTAPRALANTALALSCAARLDGAAAAAEAQFDGADNMTDRQAALAALMLTDVDHRERVLARFAETYRNDPTVMDKWFLIQATMHRLPGDEPILDRVRRLEQHPAYSASNPNKVRSLVHAFCNGNLAEFHRPDGAGYAWWQGHVVAFDKTNPHLAARLARSLDRLAKFTPPQRSLMRDALSAVRRDVRSADVIEVLDRALAST